jgi:ankyrin repeat protein
MCSCVNKIVAVIVHIFLSENHFISNGNQQNMKKGYLLKSIKDDMGRNPLHWAASNHLSEKLVSLLIEHGTPLLSTDSQGIFPP